MTDTPGAGHPAVLLDRDGVVNVDRGYVGRREDFAFLPGVLAAARRIVELGYRLVVVTNQSGIALGRYTPAAYEALTAWMRDRFAAAGAPLDGVYHCPHRPDAPLAQWRQTCPCRKPEPGLILRARDELGLDLAGSVLVGDKERDLTAGRRAGVGRLVLIRSGQPLQADNTDLADRVLDSLADLPPLLLPAGSPDGPLRSSEPGFSTGRRSDR